MRIATWSINGIRARKEVLLRWLDEQQPDVVALQKIRASEEVFREELRAILSTGRFSRFRSADYCARAWCREGEYGVAVLSRKKSEVVQEGLPGQERIGPSFLTVDVDGLEVSSVYAPYGDDIKRRANWLASLAEHIEGRASGSLQMCALRGLQRLYGETRQDHESQDRRRRTAAAVLSIVEPGLHRSLYVPYRWQRSVHVRRSARKYQAQQTSVYARHMQRGRSPSRRAKSGSRLSEARSGKRLVGTAAASRAGILMCRWRVGHGPSVMSDHASEVTEHGSLTRRH